MAETMPRGTEQPSLSFEEGNPYVRYGEIDVLLSLQRTRSGLPVESSFLIATQVMELVFRLIRQEWTIARDALGDDDLPEAMAALRRGARAQDVLVDSWELLATLTPTEFNEFRDGLGEASGFQSYGYRHLEFLLGNKSAAMVRPHKALPEVAAELDRTLGEPSLYDAALGLLRRRGLPVPPELVRRDWTQPYEPHPDVERAWSDVYSGAYPGAAAGAANDLFQLAELLLDTAERVTRWRHRHYMAVKRSMGAKPGTGGSSGLEWLRKSAERDVFPELWSLRTQM